MSVPEIYLIRHGETEWSRSGRHTGVSDIPLTEHGRQQARLLVPELAARNFDAVLTSPLQRARETCELAGLAARARRSIRISMEWNYGDYEGLTSEQIHVARPAWTIFNDGAPGGETPEQVGVRVDRVIARVRAHGGQCGPVCSRTRPASSGGPMAGTGATSAARIFSSTRERCAC